jgi:presenilin-like A22 family membrane protease
LVHNFTELLVYPGIAAVFVPLLNIYTVIGLLVLISIYDMWAVWKSGIMQKMAKYQINKLKIFSGFFVPYLSKQMKTKIKKWKKTMKKTELKKKKIKINIAILGGGDVIFPIITAGVMLKTLGLGAAILVILGATLGLGYLFFFSEKKKFYPAMPFITGGILVGIVLSYLIF